MKKLIFAGALALASTPAAADPLADLLGEVFTTPQVMQTSHRVRKARTTHAHESRASGGSTMLASFYGGGRGERLSAHTANGERFHAGGFTAAHRTLPMGTRLHVCLHGCVAVRINDRGPAAFLGRDLDLSRGAAEKIGLIQSGVGLVHVTVLR